jgi:hypothetical protein
LAQSERLDRLVAWLRTVVARPLVPSRRGQRLLVAGSVVLVVGAAIVAAGRLPPPPGEVRWWLLVPVGFLGVPASVLVNALGFRVPARMADTRVSLPRAAIVMLLARAASLVPLPAGAIVGVGALEHAGATYPRAILATGAVVLTWMGIGVREIVAGVLGVTVGLPASLRVSATVTDRLVEYVVLAPVGLAVWLRLRPSLDLEPVDRPHVSPEALP